VEPRQPDDVPDAKIDEFAVTNAQHTTSNIKRLCSTESEDHSALFKPFTIDDGPFTIKTNSYETLIDACFLSLHPNKDASERRTEKSSQAKEGSKSAVPACTLNPDRQLLIVFCPPPYSSSNTYDKDSKHGKNLPYRRSGNGST
jgi:hypothetical protein